jgi:hypothetical protein
MVPGVEIAHIIPFHYNHLEPPTAPDVASVSQRSNNSEARKRRSTRRKSENQAKKTRKDVERREENAQSHVGSGTTLSVNFQTTFSQVSSQTSDSTGIFPAATSRTSSSPIERDDLRDFDVLAELSEEEIDATLNRFSHLDRVVPFKADADLLANEKKVLLACSKSVPWQFEGHEGSSRVQN